MSANGNTVPIVTPIRNETQQGASTPNAGPNRPPSRAVSGSDIVFVNGLAYNGRGYRVCGVSNQRGTLCGRIGQCPFHAGKQPGHHPDGPVPKRRRVNPAQRAAAQAIASGSNQQQNPTAGQPSSSEAGAIPDCVRRMDAPPTKSRFKRSWTPAEHKQFLISMKKYGKGKWKEISREVKTRTANQCQSHAQKYFLRQAKSSSERKKKSIHDLTEVDLNPPAVTPATPLPDPVNTELVLPKVDPLPATIPTVSALPSPPPPIQSPSVYLTNHSPAFPLQQDNHPGASNVDALASLALATAPGCESKQDNLERSNAINAVVNAALKNASPMSNATVSEGASHVSSARGEKMSNIQIDTQTGEVANIPGEVVRGEQEDEASENEGVSTSTLLAKTGTSLAATTLQIQALAQAAQQAARRLSTSNATSDANSISNGQHDMSSLQGSFTQLLSNPQALLMLNPLLANMSGLTAGVASVPSTVAPVQRMRVTVHENGKKGGGMALLLPESNLMEDFFEMSKDILNAICDFQRVFTRSGGEITSLDQMCQDDALWLSSGDEFKTPM